MNTNIDFIARFHTGRPIKVQAIQVEMIWPKMPYARFFEYLHNPTNGQVRCKTRQTRQSLDKNNAVKVKGQLHSVTERFGWMAK